MKLPMLVLSEPASATWCPPALAPALDVVGGLVGSRTNGAPAYLLLMGGAGMGKTRGLGLLAEHAERAGLDVAHGIAPAPGPSAGGPAVRFVDDAHDLDVVLVDRLAEDAATGRLLVLAARPWPQTEAFSRLMSLLHGQGVVMLGAWEPDDVHAYLTATGAAGGDCGPECVARLVRLTGGLPWLVDGLASAGPRALPADIAGAVQARFRRLSGPARVLVEELAVGFSVDDCPAGDRSDPDAFDAAIAEVDAGGLLTPTGDLPPAAAMVVADELPVHRRRRLHRQVLATLPDHGTDDPQRFERLADAGVRDERLARGLVDIGDDVLTAFPAEAGTWYDRAEAVGAPPALLAARRAEVALRSGEPYEAARLVDAALSVTPTADPARTGRVALAVFGRTGMAARASDLGRLFGPDPSAVEAAAAATVLLAQGHGAEVTRIAAAHRPDSALPTLQEEVCTLLVEGLAASLERTPTDTLPRLARATQLAATACDEAMVPMHPGVLAALVALHGGDPASASLALHRSRSAIGADSPWHRPFALLSAWGRLRSGDLPGVARERAAAARAPWPRTARDAFWDAALAVGAARRGDDPAALVRAWREVSPELVAHQVDLYDLLPLGELHLAAVRVKDETAVDVQLRAAWDLLEGLGSPPLWETSLRWEAIQGAILANRPNDITPHAQALVHHAVTFPYAETLASAGRVWVQVLGERFAVDDVIAAAHLLRDAGQSWEAGRLLGHAAAHAASRKDSSRLLEAARAIGEVATAAPDRGPGGGTSRLPLSDREQQVARLVVAGHTYKEVGGRLFLSERTVEHHMARIRQRLGASSRAELLDRLRSLLGEANDGR